MTRKDYIAMRELAEQIALTVFAPDYYLGRWEIRLAAGGKELRKVCSNHATARAWANYFQRHGYHTSAMSIGKARV